GAALAEAEAADVDDACVRFLHRLVRKPEARHRLRPDVVHQHIGALRERQACLQRRRMLEIQDDRALVAVGVEVDRAHAGVLERPGVAHDVAAGWLDLDHVRAEVAEDLRRIRPHHHSGEIEHAHAGERTHYSGSIPASLTSFAQCAISAWMNRPNCAGSSGATSVPMAANFSFTSGFAKPLAAASCRRCTTGCGVFAGATSPNQAMSS